MTGFPNVKIRPMTRPFPDTWDANILDYANGTSDAYASSVQINFWDGLTAVDGYANVLFLDAMFSGTPVFRAPRGTPLFNTSTTRCSRCSLSVSPIGPMRRLG